MDESQRVQLFLKHLSKAMQAHKEKHKTISDMKSTLEQLKETGSREKLKTGLNKLDRQIDKVVEQSDSAEDPAAHILNVKIEKLQHEMDVERANWLKQYHKTNMLIGRVSEALYQVNKKMKKQELRIDKDEAQMIRFEKEEIRNLEQIRKKIEVFQKRYSEHKDAGFSEDKFIKDLKERLDRSINDLEQLSKQ